MDRLILIGTVEVLFLVTITFSECLTPAEYDVQRQRIIGQERSERLGACMPLNPAEQKVSNRLLSLKKKEIEMARVYGTIFPPAMNFFQTKKLIDKSQVFKIIQRMPKGGALHTHDSSITSLEWLIKNATYRPNCYMCFNKQKQLRMKFFAKPPQDNNCKWETVKSLREKSGDANQFDHYLISSIGLVVDNPDEVYRTVNDVWNKFSDYFQVLNGLYLYEPVFRDYFLQALKEFQNDNVQYIEIRALLPPVYELDDRKFDEEYTLEYLQESNKAVCSSQSKLHRMQNNNERHKVYELDDRKFDEEYTLEYLQESNKAVCSSQSKLHRMQNNNERHKVYELDDRKFDEEYTLNIYRNLTKQFVQANPNFIGCKIIMSGIRSNPVGTIMSSLKQAIHFHQNYFDIFRGYDLVGQEGPGNPLFYYLNDLLYPSQHNIDMPYYFHAGETDWEGTQVDLNLVDAVLLNTSRIGHGFALYKHPEVLKMIKTKGIAVEVNPISNQVLKLVADLRNHGAITLFANNYPLVVSSDDPAAWGALPLSHDFYMAYMAMAAEDDGLGVLKQLAINSIKYSALTTTEKATAMTKWKTQWSKFINSFLAADFSEILVDPVG